MAALTYFDVLLAAVEAGRLLPADRWRHVRGVATMAHRVAPLLEKRERRWLLAAAYLHDIGYSVALVETGSHAIDGGRWLRRKGAERLARLVAHHSGARFDAAERGLDAAMAEFEREESSVADALTFCDLTTSPVGQVVTVEARIAEIAERYGSHHFVVVAMERAKPSLLAQVRRVEARIVEAGLDLSLQPRCGALPSR